MCNRSSSHHVRTSLLFIAGVAVTMPLGLGPCSTAFCQTIPPGGFAGGAAGGYSTAGSANEVTQFTAKLKDARGNIIVVTREDGTDCMVQIPDDITSLNFSAKAVPGFLRQGTPVRFAMAIGPNGAPVSPVEKIEIFAPLGRGAVPRNQATRFTPGIHHPGQQQRRRAQPNPNQSMGGKVDVVGTLMMISPQGAIAVQAGGTPVNTMVAPNVEIEVQMNNLSLAQPGDEVEVAGFYNPPDETKVKAQRITITTDRVIGDAANPDNGKDRLKRGKGAKTQDGQQDPAAPDKTNAASDANPPGTANAAGNQNVPGGLDAPATETP